MGVTASPEPAKPTIVPSVVKPAPGPVVPDVRVHRVVADLHPVAELRVVVVLRGEIADVDPLAARGPEDDFGGVRVRHRAAVPGLEVEGGDHAVRVRRVLRELLLLLQVHPERERADGNRDRHDREARDRPSEVPGHPRSIAPRFDDVDMSSCECHVRGMKRDPKRAEQLRLAKRAQRRRERARGLVHVQLTVPARVAEKLRIAGRDPDFEKMLDEIVVRIADYPSLKDITWSLQAPMILAREACSLYERNWRFVDVDLLEPREQLLIARLTERFGLTPKGAPWRGASSGAGAAPRTAGRRSSSPRSGRRARPRRTG
jgi:hypothetical protein